MPNARHSRLTCIRTTWRRASGAEEAPDRTSKTLSDTTGPAYGRGPIGELDNDLTRQHEGEPLGERIIVTGRVLDGDERPVRDSLIEIWQANAAGRYSLDRHPAPLDPNFAGADRMPHRRRRPLLRDDQARLPVEEPRQRLAPGPHTPVTLRRRFQEPPHNPDVLSRDPLLEHDPIFQSVRDTAAQQRMISAFDLETTQPGGH